jgi:hypothetical protein
MHRVPIKLLVAGGLLLALVLGASTVQAYVGGEAELFETWNEDEQLVSMADMIDGKPLVLAVGSAS